MAGPARTLGTPSKAVEREGRRVLRALRGACAFVRLLRPAVAGPAVEAGVFASERTARPLRFDAGLIPAFMTRGWLVAGEDGRWRLGEAGRALLRETAGGASPGPSGARAESARGAPGFNDAESPLSWLRRRRGAAGQPLISELEFEAGERLRADFTRAGMMPRVTANWEGFNLPRPARRLGRPGDGPLLHDGALAARQRVAAALAAVGPDISGLLVDVCCLLVGLEDAERRRAWPKRSAKLVLRLGLGQLARHYGMAERSPRRRSHRWGAEGYRPTIHEI